MNNLANNRVLVLPGLVCALATSLVCGCSWNVDTARRVASIASIGSTGVQVKRRRQNHLEGPRVWWTSVTGYGGMKPDERSQLFLRTYALDEEYLRDPGQVVRDLRLVTNAQPDLESLHVLADLALVEGHQNRLAGNEQYAGQLLATAVAASYQYLFDPRMDHRRNIYDPVFREVCDIYNQSLEGLLRIMREQDALRPRGTFTATTLDDRPLRVTVDVAGRWQDEAFEKFEFVSDFNTEGLRNVHLTYGLGVPLIAIRKSPDATKPGEQYYPQDLSMPLTAFVQTSLGQVPNSGHDEFQIRLIDPLERTEVKVHDRFAPLESDITTPLAYFLDDPLLDANWFATAALLNGDFAQKFGGLYMLEPYDPTKIPVVMVHGFWSSPMTWTEMFNDLRSDKSIRDNYQFWFYLYPSGQPFWFSARQMRQDLAKARRALDPKETSRALGEMVLVGHSMGGLISRLQTVNSDEHFWSLVSDQSISEMKGDTLTRQRVRDTLFFDANPSIARVITLGTPHRGSNVANSMTRWLSQKLFSLPTYLNREHGQIVRDNPDFFKSDMLKIATSTDSLSPDSRFFDAMMQAEPGPHVRYHNVLGVYESRGASSFFRGSKEPSDGVVAVSSARCPDAASEIEIESEHSTIHQHPRAILEVRHILTNHLYEVFGGSRDVIRPASHETPVKDPRIDQ